MIDSEFQERQPQLTSHQLQRRPNAPRGKQHYDVTRPPRDNGHQPRPRPNFNGSSRPPKPFKPKAWSHHDDLKALIGKKVQLGMGANVFEVTIIETDAYTVMANYNGTPTIIFKHSIASITPIVEAL